MGDYARDTGHLTIIEHGVYALMLDAYYATERPLPKDIDALCRLLRAMTQAEKKAAQSILSQFWKLTDGGWINSRAATEIAKASAQADTNRRIARERTVPRTVPRNGNESFDEPSHERVTPQTPDPRLPDKESEKSPNPNGPTTLKNDNMEILMGIRASTTIGDLNRLLPRIATMHKTKQAFVTPAFALKMKILKEEK